jgi:hypothetical protein
MDWCGGHDISGSYNNMSRALNATGRQIGFNLCEWGDQKPWEWGPALAQSWRITKDHSGQWSSTKYTIAKAGSIPSEYSGKPYGWNGTVYRVCCSNYDGTVQCRVCCSNYDGMTPQKYDTNAVE